jgi:hypothetical protein
MATTSEPQLPEGAARNQSRFREYNERIEPHNRAHTWNEPPMPDWVCECAFVECVMPVRLTIAEYEAVRADPTCFLVAPGDDHVVPDVERVIERHERYWVVEKIAEAAEVSEALDARDRDAASQAETAQWSADQAAWNLPAASGKR